MVPNFNSTVLNLAWDGGSESKNKSAEHSYIAFYTSTLTSCHRVLSRGSFTGNAHPHPGRGQKWKKQDENEVKMSLGQSHTVWAEKLSG